MASNSQIPFLPLGQTVLVASNPTAPAGVQAPIDPRFNAKNPAQYRVINDSDDTVFLGVGQTAAEAQANAADIAGGVTNAIVLVPGAIEILRFHEASYFSAYSANPADVYVLPGQGI
jgi:hypothetical protein